MDLEQFPPYRDGQPIGFVYQERRHPPSYQVHRIDSDDPVIQTSDIEELSREARAVGQIVWLDRRQIAALNIPLGKEGMRPLNMEEAAKLAA